MEPFRDEDRSQLATFAQHIKLAETFLGIAGELSDGLNSDSTPDERRAPSETWVNLWEQLGQARAIAVRFDRDVAAYDAARAKASNPYLLVAASARITGPLRAIAREAIAGLRAAFPEVVVPEPKPLGAGERMTPPPAGWWPSPFAIYRIGMLVTVLVVALAYSLCGG